MKPPIEYRPGTKQPPLFKDGDEIFKSVTLIKRDKAKHAKRMREWRKKKKGFRQCLKPGN